MMKSIIGTLFLLEREKAFKELQATEKVARKIMGRNFFGMEEAVRYFNLRPTKRQLIALTEIPFTSECLEASKETHLLVAVLPLSISDLRKRIGERAFNNSKYYDYARDSGEEFVTVRGTIGWQLVRKTVVPGSKEKRWLDQQALLADGEETPSARVMVYMIIAYYLMTGECLFEHHSARCSEVDSEGYRVDVGLFGLGYLDINSETDDFLCAYMGLASAFKSTR